MMMNLNDRTISLKTYVLYHELKKEAPHLDVKLVERKAQRNDVIALKCDLEDRKINVPTFVVNFVHDNTMNPRNHVVLLKNGKTVTDSEYVVVEIQSGETGGAINGKQ